MLFPRTSRESPTKTTELGTTLIRMFSHRRSQGNAEQAKHALMWVVTSGGAALNTREAPSKGQSARVWEALR